MKKIHGLTLIELLIASTIFVVIMISAYSAMHVGIFGFRKIEENIQASQTARQVMERLDRDLRNAFCFSKDEARFQGTSNEISFFTLVDAYRNDKVAQDYAQVSYMLEADKLMRLCRRNKDILDNQSTAQAQEFASGVEIVFSYALAKNGPELVWLNQWGKESSAENLPKTLPAAVKVKLIFIGKVNKDFERTIFLPSAQ